MPGGVPRRSRQKEPIHAPALLLTLCLCLAEKGDAPAPKQPKKNLFGGAPPKPQTPVKAQPQEKPKKDLTGAAVKKKTALALSAPQMAEEEWAALFRNNLLRSCWKPGLTSDEVQHVLTLWERKLVEVRLPPEPTSKPSAHPHPSPRRPAPPHARVVRRPNASRLHASAPPSSTPRYLPRRATGDAPVEAP